MLTPLAGCATAIDGFTSLLWEIFDSEHDRHSDVGGVLSFFFFFS